MNHYWCMAVIAYSVIILVLCLNDVILNIMAGVEKPLSPLFFTPVIGAIFIPILAVVFFAIATGWLKEMLKKIELILPREETYL
ncbi:MAG: hypothetical protein JW816_01140 [Candidatus Buchananbacteria bacterium]|nr:hypothetical protein [Candidatus Buchananbacteria bacterium]